MCSHLRGRPCRVLAVATFCIASACDDDGDGPRPPPGRNWANVSPSGTSGIDFPAQRYRHAMAFDSNRNVVVLFGGDSGSLQSDTWEWNGTSWARTAGPGAGGVGLPTARDYLAMAFDANSVAVVLFGGYPGGASYSDETWLYRWVQVNQAASYSTPLMALS